MDTATLDALKGSIEKWQKIVDGTGTDQGRNNCPLCQMFNRDVLKRCRGCPVMEKTGLRGCWNTPYDIYNDPDTYPETQNQAAIEELSFLTSLLPEGETP